MTLCIISPIDTSEKCFSRKRGHAQVEDLAIWEPIECGSNELDDDLSWELEMENTKRHCHRNEIFIGLKWDVKVIESQLVEAEAKLRDLKALLLSAQ